MRWGHGVVLEYGWRAYTSLTLDFRGETYSVPRYRRPGVSAPWYVIRQEVLVEMPQRWCALTVHVVRSEGDLDAEGLVGVPDGGQRQVGQRLLSEVGHHSLCTQNTHAHTRTHTRKHTHTHTHTHTRTHARRHTHTHTRARMHTQTQSGGIMAQCITKGDGKNVSICLALNCVMHNNNKLMIGYLQYFWGI